MRLPRLLALGVLAALLVTAALALSVRQFAIGPARATGEAMAVDCDTSLASI